jgi:nicotinamidase-related amidase
MKKVVVLIVILLAFAASINAQTKNEPAANRIRPALLVIDIQNEYLPMIPERDREVGLYMINAYIGLFRQNNFPIIRVYHTDPTYGPKPGTENFEFPTTVQIKADDPKIIKNFPSGFKKTELEKLLREKKCNTLFLCGLSSVGCVISTYFGARDLDFNTFLIKDAIMSHNSTYTRNIEEIFGAVNDEVVKLMLESAEPPSK